MQCTICSHPGLSLVMTMWSWGSEPVLLLPQAWLSPISWYKIQFSFLNEVAQYAQFIPCPHQAPLNAHGGSRWYQPTNMDGAQFCSDKGIIVPTFIVGFYFWLGYIVAVSDFDMCHCQTDEFIKLQLIVPVLTRQSYPIQVLPKFPSLWLPKEYSQLPLD